AEGQKSGVAPARFGAFSAADFLLGFAANSFIFRQIPLPQRAEPGEGERAGCQLYLLHLSSLGSSRLPAKGRSSSARKCTVCRNTLSPNSARMSVSVTRAVFHPR